jgi:hypothetical protein
MKKCTNNQKKQKKQQTKNPFIKRGFQLINLFCATLFTKKQQL